MLYELHTVRSGIRRMLRRKNLVKQTRATCYEVMAITEVLIKVRIRVAKIRLTYAKCDSVIQIRPEMRQELRAVGLV